MVSRCCFGQRGVRMRADFRALLAVVVLLTASSAWSQQADDLLTGDGLLESFSLSADRGPVRIEASTLEFDYKSGLLTYRGKVRVHQADIELSSDTLSVHLDAELTGRPREIVARGNVRVVSGEREATGGRAEFNQSEQTVTLSENAILRDGPNEVSGERVVVYLREERSVVEGGSDRVRATLFPSGSAEDDESLSLSRAPDHD